MDKGIRNRDAIARKLGLVLTKSTNQSLEVASEKKQKKEKMVERRKTKAMVIKRQRAKRGLSLSNEEKEDFKSDNGDEINLDQADDKYPL